MSIFVVKQNLLGKLPSLQSLIDKYKNSDVTLSIGSHHFTESIHIDGDISITGDTHGRILGNITTRLSPNISLHGITINGKIYCVEESEISVSNCRIESPTEGIYLTQNGKARIIKSKFICVKSQAIISNSDGELSIEDTDIESHESVAIEFSGNSTATVSNSSICSQCETAMVMRGNSSISLLECTVNTAGEKVSLYLEGTSKAKIIKTNITGNSIHLCGTVNATIRQCNVKAKQSGLIVSGMATAEIDSSEISSANKNAIYIDKNSRISCNRSNLTAAVFPAIWIGGGAVIHTYECLVASDTSNAIYMTEKSNVNISKTTLKSSSHPTITALGESVSDINESHFYADNGNCLSMFDNSKSSVCNSTMKNAGHPVVALTSQAYLFANNSKLESADGNNIICRGDSKISISCCNLVTSGFPSLYFDDDSSACIEGGEIKTCDGACIISSSKADVAVVGASLTASNSSTIVCSDESSLSINKCALISEGIFSCLVLGSSGSTKIDKCSITSTGADGVEILSSSTAKFNSCTISSCGGNGISLHIRSDAHIIDCTMELNKAHGIFAMDGSFGKVLKCVFNNNLKTPQIHIESRSNLLVDNIVSIECDATKGTVEDKQQIVTHGHSALSPMLDLQTLIGLESVKSSVLDLCATMKIMKERIAFGLPQISIPNLHCLFLGNPGTGKTTVARILGSIYKEIGVLKSGHLVEVDRSGLVGKFIGETAIKTKSIIEEAMGGVLLIDEAYTLKPSDNDSLDFGGEAIDTLLKVMEDHRGEFVVVAAGYPDKMNKFINHNPGLKDRFPNSLFFEDYTPEELMQIFKSQASKFGFKFGDDVQSLITHEFARLYSQRDGSFGNARVVRNFLEKIQINHARRLYSLPDRERTKNSLESICMSDVEPLVQATAVFNRHHDLNVATKELSGLVGLDNVKNQINLLKNLVQFDFERHKQGLNPPPISSLHCVFTGNPGTGKTTVARLIGKIYHALGLLSRGHVIEVDRKDLVAGYVGQTAVKTKQVIELAQGGVLFIDEAYTLASGKESAYDFGSESIDTLLKEMEDKRGSFVVIVAGYPDLMSDFIATNPGLQSRFSKVIHFDDYNPNELLSILISMCSQNELILSDKAKIAAHELFSIAHATKDKYFGNGRYVRNLFERAKENMAQRVLSLPVDLRSLQVLSTLEGQDFV